MSSVDTLNVGSFSRCSHADETRMRLNLPKAAIRAAVTDKAGPSSTECSSGERDNETTKAMALSIIVEDDLFHGGIVSDDDSWSEHPKTTPDDDDLSISAISEMDEATSEALRSSFDASNGDRIMEVEDDALLEPLDYRVLPESKGAIIQGDCDWELVRPALMRIMYSK
eukprot:CAMPEP_0197448604 /NCGR_PEP_ID=MMETSP1175-20131217/18174_1 /TAXON_ID=1003142 /ORGANISM="Triceratium dubium, Strain CCMP147" /LENGTH=168 /DNA_ID=CAMNT_0042980419 /DNA_START=246 /DNA_END=752 /DNA_ORIENTATION=-